MKRSIFALVLLLSASFTGAKVQNVGDEVILQVAIYDPTEDQEPIKKSPVRIPSVSISEYTLHFATPCDGCVLRLLNEEGDEAFATVIPTGTADLTLPTSLAGEYELQIVRGNYCFWGYIWL